MRRPTKGLRRVSPLTAALAVVSAVGIIGTTAFAPEAGADSRPASHTAHTDHSCVHAGGGAVTEQTIRFNYIGSPPAPTPIQKVGDTVTYWDEIYDAHNNVIGHTIGYVTAVRLLAPGHLLTEYHETVELPQGRLNATGYMERQAMLEGRTVHLYAVGVSGEFAGKTGYRDWALKKPIPNPLTSDERVTMSIALCS